MIIVWAQDFSCYPAWTKVRLDYYWGPWYNYKLFACPTVELFNKPRPKISYYNTER